MKIKYLLLSSLILIAFYSIQSYAQENLQFGNGLKPPQTTTRGGFYDYSDPSGINIKVEVYGYVNYPGEYIIPASTGVNELLGLAGGPTQDALLQDLRIFRINPDSSQTLIRFNYNDLLWTDNGLTKPIKIPSLKAGDILLVPGEPRYFFKDYLAISVSILSALISLGILILDLNKK
jgi:SLBB domain